MKKQLFLFILSISLSISVFSQISKGTSIAWIEGSTTFIEDERLSKVVGSYGRFINNKILLGSSIQYDYYKTTSFGDYRYRDFNFELNGYYFFNPKSAYKFFGEIAGSLGRSKIKDFTGWSDYYIVKNSGFRLGVGALSFIKNNTHLALSTKIAFVNSTRRFSGQKFNEGVFVFNQSITPFLSPSLIDKTIENSNNLLKRNRITGNHNLGYTFEEDSPLIINSKLGYFVFNYTELELAGFAEIYGDDDSFFALNPKVNFYLPLANRLSFMPSLNYLFAFSDGDSEGYWGLSAGLNYFLNRHIALQAAYNFTRYEDFNQNGIAINLKYFMR